MFGPKMGPKMVITWARNGRKKAKYGELWNMQDTVRWGVLRASVGVLTICFHSASFLRSLEICDFFLPKMGKNAVKKNRV